MGLLFNDVFKVALPLISLTVTSPVSANNGGLGNDVKQRGFGLRKSLLLLLFPVYSP